MKDSNLRLLRIRIINKSLKREIKLRISQYSLSQSNYKTQKQRRLARILTSSLRMRLTRTSSESLMFPSLISDKRLQMQMLLLQRWTWSSPQVQRLSNQPNMQHKSSKAVKHQSCHSHQQEEVNMITIQRVVVTKDRQKQRSNGKRHLSWRIFERETLAETMVPMSTFA